MTTTLVLLPGMDGTGRLFGRIRACLEDRFQTTHAAYPVDRQASRSELLGIVEAAVPPEGDYVLVAESFSGSLAIAHAASGPGRLRAVVLVASFCASPLPRGFRWLRMFAGAAGLPLPGFLVRLLLVGGGASSELARDVKDAIASVRPEVLVDRMRQVFEVDVRSLVASVTVPVLHLHGRQDRLVGARGRVRSAPRSERVRSERIDGPHLLLQARPRECAEAIARFLGELV